jgi:pimeloyl-ACP methyl ester carboxylesterase
MECGESNAVSLIKSTPHSFDTAHGKISAILEGNGDPVVFIHGNSSTKSVWSHQIAAARGQGRAVLALDLPGHGGSEGANQPETTYSIPGYATVIRSLCENLNWTAFDIVGWSLGGHVGLELLATDKRVRSLLILGAPPVKVEADAVAEAFCPTELLGLAGKAVLSDAEAYAFATATLGDWTTGGTERLFREHLNDVKRTHGIAREMLFASILKGMGADERKAVETIDTPVCIVHGEKDPFIRLDYLQSLKYRNLWHDRIFVITGAGHAPHMQCPNSFSRILLEFLGAR